MSPMALLGIFLLFFIGLAMFCKMPVGYSIGAATLAVIFANGMKTSTLCTVAFSGLDSFPLLAVPLFIFAGAIMQHSGIAHALVNLIDSIVGRIRGSLGAVTVLASAAFGVLTGSCMATISCIGGIMVPEMKKKGYSPSYCAALAAASSFLGILIPPSVPGIMYGLCASVSISAVWLSTIGPAILCTILFITINYFKQGRKEVKDTAPITASLYFGNVGKSFLKSIPALIMPVIIFGGIYGGIFTATEAGAAAVLYGTLFYFGKKVLHLGGTDSSFMQMTVDSAISTATICILIGFSNCSGRVISMIGIAEAIKAFVTSHIASATVFLIFANILFLICGMLIDINAAILLVVPLLLPTATAMGIDTIHFGAIILVNLSVGFITPPFCSSVFMAQKLSGARYVDIIKDVMPFVIASLVVVVLTTYIPALSTYIPNMAAAAAAA
jgi:C4-dicarboxylate transporter DctM subunit